MNRAKYTPAEDKALLDFAAAHGKSYPPTGNKLWQVAEAQRVTPHTWQSMKSRFLLLSGAKKKGTKRPSDDNSQPSTQQQRLSFTPTMPNLCLPLSFHLLSPPSTSTSTRPTSTSTSTTSTLPRTLFTHTQQPRPTTTDGSTQTDGTGIVSLGVGLHLFCPVTQYRPVDVAVQTERQPYQHRRSYSILVTPLFT